MINVPGVTLTEDEHEECQAFVTSMIPPSDEGQWAMRKDLVETFKRNLVAKCMMGRAKRFAILAQEQPKFRGKACEAAAKACAVYPLSAYFYDFACILDQLGEEQEASVMLANFLRRHAAEPVNEVDTIALKEHDVTTMVRQAKERLNLP
jgi:hypothetical protein